MRGFRTSARTWVWVAVAAGSCLGVSAGCQSPAPKRITSTEPGLSDHGATVVESVPPPSTSYAWVDRHPLFSKPRDYYENAGSNKVVKAAAATVIGIPAGIFGEIRQIVVGPPAQAKY
jgi:hypothetical protein